ncbi:MAG: dihydropteroate synthase [Pseudomonadota bacterium]
MLTLQDLYGLYERHQHAADVRVENFSIGGRHFDFGATKAIMGVVNLSTDSWYRESVCMSPEAAVRRARVLAAQGADIIDIGAESTLPHAARVDGAAQKNALLPVLETLAGDGILTSIETYDASVAKETLRAGAAIINLTGPRSSEEIYSAIAEADAGVIICYVQGETVRDVEGFDLSRDPVAAMYEFFAREIDVATGLGVSRIFIDAGLGFYYKNLLDSKTRIQFQMQTFLSAFRLRNLGFPVCNALPHAFEYFGDEVRSAEPFFAVLAALGQTDLYRTHEVPRVKAVLDTLALY